MLRKIVLHGALGKRFGHSFTFDVTSPADALRALIAQIDGFRAHFRDGHYRIVRGKMRDGHALDLEGCKASLGRAAELHIVPVVAGAGNGLGKILAGVALVALAVFVPLGAVAIGALGTIGFNSVVGAIGFSLALGGIGQMLSPSPSLSGGQAAADKKNSFLFGGQDNVASQGGPVPAVYGTFETGSVLISAALTTEQLL